MSDRIPEAAYHGAFKPVVAAPSINHWRSATCTAFVYDILTSPLLPTEYETCDVIVADLPWANGFDTFNERANVTDGRTYTEFLARVSEIVRDLAIPVYLVTGRHAKARLPKADIEIPTRLNEDRALIYAYRPSITGRYGVPQELLFALARVHHTVGDFCAGYGRTGRIFLRNGKKAVLTDINPQCVGYIAEHAPGWAK